MKLKINLLAGAAILSAVSLTTFAQTAAIHDGSNASRAPLPANLPADYSTVTTLNADGSGPQTGLAANHIGAPASDQANAVVVITPSTTQPVLTPTGRSVEIAGAALGASEMSSQIRSNSTATSEQLLEIEARVAASEKSMATTRSTMPALSTDGQEQFKLANSDVTAKAQSLRQSITAARNTNTKAASEQVAADYEAYATAVARFDALASGQP